MRFTHPITAAFLACTIGSSALATSIVVNGSFESQPIPGGVYGPYSAGDPALTPWVIASGNVDHIGNSYWQAADGVQSLDMNGTHLPGSIYQDLVTVPGQQYLLTFELAGNPDGLPEDKTLQVQWDGGVIGNAVANITGFNHANMGYQTKSFVVFATGALTRLQFTSLVDGPYGPVLDAVAVQPVPLPTTACAGLTLLTALALRRATRPMPAQ